MNITVHGQFLPRSRLVSLASPFRRSSGLLFGGRLSSDDCPSSAAFLLGHFFDYTRPTKIVTLLTLVSSPKTTVAYLFSFSSDDCPSSVCSTSPLICARKSQLGPITFINIYIYHYFCQLWSCCHLLRSTCRPFILTKPHPSPTPTMSQKHLTEFALLERLLRVHQPLLVPNSPLQSKELNMDQK